MSQTITINVLSQKSINNAIKKLEEYKDSLSYKCEEFVRQLAEVGIPIIDNRMNKARFTVADTSEDGTPVYKGANTTHYTNIRINSYGDYSEAILSVQGEDLLFIEFGAGVYYNGQAGSSPHPYGEKLGYRIGYYGEGHGKQKIWGYYDDSGVLVLTHGVKATMPVYSAWQEIYKQIGTIARKVFSNG